MVRVVSIGEGVVEYVGDTRDERCLSEIVKVEEEIEAWIAESIVIGKRTKTIKEIKNV